MNAAGKSSPYLHIHVCASGAESFQPGELVSVANSSSAGSVTYLAGFIKKLQKALRISSPPRVRRQK